MTDNILLKELLSRQLKDVPNSRRLKYKDFVRMIKYINSSIFDEEICSVWNGYVTNINNSYKGLYINFYFKKKKTALHRLLYSNFKGSLDDDDYIKFSCENKGKCCNVNHMIKFKYYSNQPLDTEPKLKTQNKSKYTLSPFLFEEDSYFLLTFN